MPQYELKPFKLKILSSKEEVKDPLETMPGVSSLKDPPKRQIKSHIGFRSGFSIAFENDKNPDFSLPYFSLTYRVHVYKSRNWFIVLDNSLIIAQDVKEEDLLKNLKYYYIPSLGVRLRF